MTPSACTARALAQKHEGNLLRSGVAFEIELNQSPLDRVSALRYPVAICKLARCLCPQDGVGHREREYRLGTPCIHLRTDRNSGVEEYANEDSLIEM